MNKVEINKKIAETQPKSSVSTHAATVAAQDITSIEHNPHFRNANHAACELLALIKDGLPVTAASTDDRLRLEAIHQHSVNEIETLADGFSAIGTLVSLAGQVADDAGISGITLIRLGMLIEHMAVTLDAANELRSDAAFTLSQAARGAV